jgi:hypothetical protein
LSESDNILDPVVLETVLCGPEGTCSDCVALVDARRSSAEAALLVVECDRLREYLRMYSTALGVLNQRLALSEGRVRELEEELARSLGFGVTQKEA